MCSKYPLYEDRGLNMYVPSNKKYEYNRVSLPNINVTSCYSCLFHILIVPHPIVNSTSKAT
jgi:hypothetical protein